MTDTLDFNYIENSLSNLPKDITKDNSKIGKSNISIFNINDITFMHYGVSVIMGNRLPHSLLREVAHVIK